MIQTGTTKHAPDIAKLLVHIWQTCYLDFLPKEFLENLDIEHQTRRHRQKLADGIPYFVDLSPQEEVIGFTSFGPARSIERSTEMELYTLYVHPDHHKQGIGSSLLYKVLQELPSTQHGIIVEVMEENPFREFYVKNGFKKVGFSSMELGGVKIKNCIYKQ